MLKKSKPSKMINRLKTKETVEAEIESEPTGVIYVGHLPYGFVEEGLREYFGQYGRILQVTLNKEKAFQSENQGICFSVYLTYSSEKEASIALLAID
jgi:RNA recognition motif-containing protein